MERRAINGFARYVINHWQGRQGLTWSFWVNFVILRLVLFLFQETGATFLPPGRVFPVWLVMPVVVIFHGCIFVWQAVGLLRAADRYCQGSGQMFKVWGSQLALIVAALWVLSYSLEAWYLTQPQTDTTMPSLAELEAKRATRYSLSLSDDQTFVVLEGSLELGITKRLSTLLDAHPSVKTIRLTSPGGNIFEARSLAAQIQNRGLATSVDSECSPPVRWFLWGVTPALSQTGRNSDVTNTALTPT